MAGPFLTVVTRTFQRPQMLERCVASVWAQADKDFQHIVLADDVGVGIAGSYQQMIDEADRYRGQYIYILDDDDVLTDDQLIVDLKRIADRHNPDVVMVKAEHPELGVLPEPWEDEPVYSQVCVSNFVVKAGVWRENAWAFLRELDVEAHDFAFISHLWQVGHTFHWHDRVVMSIPKVHRGEAA